MGFVNDIIERFVSMLGESETIQGDMPSQRFRDYQLKGDKYSVECDVGESLADLMLMLSSMPITGDSARAKWLDGVADYFYRTSAKKLVSAAFETGDAIAVPSYNGRNIQNIVVDSQDFEVLATSGDELTACAYVVDRRTWKDSEYTLLQAIELVPYSAAGGDSYANRYRMMVARDGAIIPDGLSIFNDWKEHHGSEWYIPNVDRLLVGRYKSFAINPGNLNSVKGVPICYGASEAMREIHYLLGQMHDEFGMSEKAIMASKALFEKEERNGEMTARLPRGRERLFIATRGHGKDGIGIEEWAPEIRYQAYLEAIDFQMKQVERNVGVSHGVISDGNDLNYQNTDNVRKSQQKTMSFISTARSAAEDCLDDLVYAWNVLANYYQITPVGEYQVSYDWSDEYIESLTDRREAILAGNSIGATDALDYRMFVMHESPEAARERIEEIAAAKSVQVSAIEEA